MLDCKHATQLASQAMDKPLPLRQRIALRVHLWMCDACTQFQQQVRLMRKAVTRVGQRIENDDRLVLSEQARQRIAEMVAQQAGQIEEARRNPDQHSTD